MYSKSRRFPRKYLPLIRIAALVLVLAAAGTWLAQNVSAKTYVITDGDRVVTYTTFATDPAEVLGEMGLELGASDSYTTEAVGDAAAITIRRGQNVTIKYHGQTMQVSSDSETVGELLSRLNLEVTGEDLVSHGMDVETYDGLDLCIDRKVTVEEVYTRTMPHEVSYCNDPSVPTGMTEVLTEGVDGEVQCVASVTYVNGVETRRKILSETMTRSPVAEVIGIGTGSEPKAVDPKGLPVITDGCITLPTGEILTYDRSEILRAAAFTHCAAGCDFITGSGTTIHWGVMAGTAEGISHAGRILIVAGDGSYAYGLAASAGAEDSLELYMPEGAQCADFGHRDCTVYFLG